MRFWHLPCSRIVLKVIVAPPSNTLIDIWCTLLHDRLASVLLVAIAHRRHHVVVLCLTSIWDYFSLLNQPIKENIRQQPTLDINAVEVSF